MWGYGNCFGTPSQPKGGSPMHYHKTFSETFTAVEGTLGLKLKSGERRLQPGESYTVKPFEVHGFFNPSASESIRFSIRLAPGHSGFENALRIMYGLAQDGLTDKNGIPKDLGVAFWLGELNDSHVDMLAFKVLSPLGKFLAKKVKNPGKIRSCSTGTVDKVL
ncbi:cupin domain-containing protein [Nitritalea halalkaliphila]|nr:cupin domain-containing protein [Nitritalea halalkaliphila]